MVSHFLLYLCTEYRFRATKKLVRPNYNKQKNREQDMQMGIGDNVLISPQVTHKSDWTEGKIIDIENNSFVGLVISAQTPSGEIFFDKEYLFKPAE